MTTPRRMQMGTGAAAIVLVSVAIGAGGTYLLMRNEHRPASAPMDPAHTTATNQPPAAAEAGAAGDRSSPARHADVVVTLSKDAVARAGIEVEAVTTGTAIGGLRVPGVVEPNAYRQVTVTPLVAGRVVRVLVQLGDQVHKGQPLAEVYSPELAEARTKYVAARAMLEAHDRELQRTQKLVEIGAASRQELERIHAEHAAQSAEVDSTWARLQLLGADVVNSSSKPQDNATTTVPAPIDGIVTERLANPGLNVDPAARLFTIVDLANVWIVGDVYERDLQRVHEGTRANITTAAYPLQPMEGRISFIDPQLNTATRTAKVRIEVANPRRELRLGMYTDVAIDSTMTGTVLTIPRVAVQNVAARQVVYVSSTSDGATFIERNVRLGRAADDRVEVLDGLSVGESVVAKGSFFVRAEIERLGLRHPEPPPSAATTPSAPMTSSSEVQATSITITEKGFEPDAVTVRVGVLTRLTFIRTTDKTCATKVVFPSLDLERALPLNQPVAVEFTPSKPGHIAFVCGMNMLRGAVAVE